MAIFISARILGVIEVFLSLYLYNSHLHILSPINELMALFILIGERKKVVEYLISIFCTFLFVSIFFVDSSKGALIFIKGLMKLFIECGFLQTFLLFIVLMMIKNEQLSNHSKILFYFLFCIATNNYLEIITKQGLPNLMSTFFIPNNKIIFLLTNLINNDIACLNLLKIYYYSYFFFLTWNNFIYIKIITSPFKDKDKKEDSLINYEGGIAPDLKIIHTLIFLFITIVSNCLFFNNPEFFYIQVSMLMGLLGFICACSHNILWFMLYRIFKFPYMIILFSLFFSKFNSFRSTQFFLLFFIYFYKFIDRYF